MQQKTTIESRDSANGFFDDPEWRALSWGVGGAIALLLGGLAVGLAQGSLLPGDCVGLACLFTTIVVMYTGIVLAVWVVAGTSVALAKRRWPTSTWRLWVLRALAVLSWAPLAGLIFLAVD